MGVDVDPEVFSVFGHAEAKPKTTQDACNDESSRRRQALGHHNSLKLPSNQGQPAFLG